ncbi:MAG: amidohydrolase family protein [Acidobacteria bacterium]|nr:amidohydrolase family protein [Acidobacteriota bacterium]
MRIDAHHHFWKYTVAEYDWIDDSMARIRRDFLPADLEAELRAAGIDGAVSVQARQTLEESEFLLGLADAHDFLKAVVGWVPLIEPDVAEPLDRFRANPKFRGVRHVLQGEADDRYMLREDFNRGISLLADRNLVYDILIFERHLPQTLQLVDRHPKQTFVLDHIAKPRIKDGALSPWQSLIIELAHRPNVYCKVSGMVTEADYKSWTPEQLRPYFDTVLSAFGPKRILFGSDWPVCLVACEYGRWAEIVRGWISELSPAEQARILGGTAAEAYGL